MARQSGWSVLFVRETRSAPLIWLWVNTLYPSCSHPSRTVMWTAPRADAWWHPGPNICCFWFHPTISDPYDREYANISQQPTHVITYASVVFFKLRTLYMITRYNTGWLGITISSVVIWLFHLIINHIVAYTPQPYQPFLAPRSRATIKVTTLPPHADAHCPAPVVSFGSPRRRCLGRSKMGATAMATKQIGP